MIHIEHIPVIAMLLLKMTQKWLEIEGFRLALLDLRIAKQWLSPTSLTTWKDSRPLEDTLGEVTSISDFFNGDFDFDLIQITAKASIIELGNTTDREKLWPQRAHGCSF